jgi:hypothetical protein
MSSEVATWNIKEMEANIKIYLAKDGMKWS